MMFLSSVNMNAEYTCGTGNLVFTGTIPYIVSMIVTIIKIAVPILLIILTLIMLNFLRITFQIQNLLMEL